jgi:catechol 2,3-dioxygenase-like lactoylglutathione lyase family enzyme
MSIGIEGILQVKFPVTDLQGSVTWYARVFDLRLGWEFVEEGVVRGAVLTDERERFLIGLRDRAVVPGQPEYTADAAASANLAVSSATRAELSIESGGARTAPEACDLGTFRRLCRRGVRRPADR